jgi:photosystem II stability/assembly factor-like uncharacterized protein
MNQSFHKPLASGRSVAVLPLALLNLYFATSFVLSLPAAAQSVAPSPSASPRPSVQSAAYLWGNVAIGGGGFVSGIIPSDTQPGLMYARTDVGGAYRWEAAQQRWIPLLDWVSEDERGYMGVESLALDPKDSNRVYMLVGTSYFNNGKTAVLRSRDRGATFAIADVTAQFKAHGNGVGRGTGERLAVDPNNGNILFCGTRADGLFKSIDAGVTWSKVSSLVITTTPNGNGIDFVVFDPSTDASTLENASGKASQTVIVGVCRTGLNLYRSNDGGQTFEAIPSAPADLMPQRAVLASDRSLYITYGNGAGPHGTNIEALDRGQIWKYNLATGTWTNVTPAGVTRPFGGISVDPRNPRRLIASTVNTWLLQGEAYGDHFFLTTDGGASWTNVVERGFQRDHNGVAWIDSSNSIHWASSIEFDPFNTKRVYVISGNGLYITENIDATPTVWKFNVRGLEETVPLNLVSIPNGGPVLSVIGDYDGFRSTDVSQYAPIHMPRMGTTNGLAYAYAQPNKVVRAGKEIYLSNDTGVTWTKTASTKGTQGIVALSADGQVLLHTPERSQVTYRSTDNGTTWSTVNGLDFQAAVASDAMNATRFYAYNPDSGTFLVSVDRGATFAATASLPSGGSKRIQPVPQFAGHLWVALGQNGLTRTTDGGRTFKKLPRVSACGAVGMGKAAPGTTYPTLFIWGNVGGVTGLFRSTDQGATWSRINDDAHEWGGTGNGQFVIGDMNHFGRVYMSTVGRGIVMGEPRKAQVKRG